MTDIYKDLQQLGSATALPQSPEAAVLEKVANPQAGTAYCVRFTAPEFTSLCPMTGQPDFAHLVIDYVPGHWLVESKSLKLTSGPSAITVRFTKIAPFRSAEGSLICSPLPGCASAATGNRAAAFRSMSSTRPDRCRRPSGCRIKACTYRGRG